MGFSLGILIAELESPVISGGQTNNFQGFLFRLLTFHLTSFALLLSGIFYNLLASIRADLEDGQDSNKTFLNSMQNIQYWNTRSSGPQRMDES